jgi:hypothetical protein
MKQRGLECSEYDWIYQILADPNVDVYFPELSGFETRASIQMRILTGGMVAGFAAPWGRPCASYISRLQICLILVCPFGHLSVERIF